MLPGKNSRNVAFGDVVQDIKRNVDRDTTTLTRYVAGQHMLTEDIHLREWGEIGIDYLGPAFHRKFEKGQVLYGSRRTYLKKVAVAEFDGITSNTTFVLNAKQSEFLQELLPFLMLSDAFTMHSVRESKGSVNPYINWKDIAKFRFELPSIAEQKKAAELLLQADLVCERIRDLLGKAIVLKRILAERLTIRGASKFKTKKTRLGSIPSHWDVVPLREILEVCQYGLSIPLHLEGQYPILRMMNYDDGRIVANDLKYVDLSLREFEEFKLKSGDILFNRTNSAELVGKVGIFRLEGDFVFASYLVRIRTDASRVLPDFLNYYLNTELGQRRLLAYATPGVSQTNISAGNLKRVLVPVPTLIEQQQAVDAISEADCRMREIEIHLANASRVKKELIENVFSTWHHTE